MPLIVSQQNNGALIFQASKIEESFGGNKEDGKDWKNHKLSSRMSLDIARYGFGLWGDRNLTLFEGKVKDVKEVVYHKCTTSN